MKNFHTISLFCTKKFPWFSHQKNPLTSFFPKDDRATFIYNFLLLWPCTLFVLQTSQNRFGFFISLVSSFYICDDPSVSNLYAFLICLLCRNGHKCSEEKCKQCMDGFEGDIIRFPCVQKCQRCNYCRGFLANLGVCKKHCQNGVQGCIIKCKNGKKICLACHCT